MRQTISVTKNVRGFTSSAPAASTNGVKGNGGGIRSSTASATAPFLRTRARMRSRRLRGTQRSSPCSPILTPIQKVSAAPATDPAVASSGTIHHKLAQPRGEDDHGGVDAERQREEQRRVERGEDDDAERRCAEGDDPMRQRAHRATVGVARRGPDERRGASALADRRPRVRHDLVLRRAPSCSSRPRRRRSCCARCIR